MTDDKKSTETEVKKDKKVGNMKIHIPIEIVELIEKDGFKYAKIECSAIEYIKQAMTSELIAEFINDELTKKFLCKIIGIDTLTQCYDKTLLMDHLPWTDVKDYYIDHIDSKELLGHIGYESCKEFWRERLEQEFSMPNAINSDNGKTGILGKKK
jgi:hypothetical protein